MSTLTKKLITILTLFALVACKAEERSTSTTSTTVAADVAANAAPEAAKSMQRVAPSQQMIVRNANLSITVKDTAATVDAVTKAAEALGGYVAQSRVWRSGELLHATLTLRVPSAQLTPTLASIRALALRVENEAISSQEVTAEYTDLGAQLRNLEATEAELLELMKTVRERSKKASEVLEMHQQISEVRGQIEQTKGRMRYLEQVTSLADVQVEIAPDAVQQPVVESGWSAIVVARDASRALVAAAKIAATALIWIVIYMLPIALVLLAIWRMGRRWRARFA
ncbi:MAG TPA: DUF4349 domain-containing protein [Thermoanaerobaculia bacterium]|nr:DUF4349 domain-containing protein [Thermoanaerobaculia bacterium]